MKEISQQPATSKIELTKLKSNTNEGSSLSISKELQLDTSFNQDLHQRDKDNVNNMYIDCLGEGESPSAIQCLDHETGKEKDLPPKLEHSESVIGITKIPIGNRSTFRNNTCSPSGPRSRSTPLLCFPPISPTPSLPYILLLKINQTKNKDLHCSSVKKKIIATTSDPSLNHPSPTNTIKYMKDNNIAKKINTIQLKKKPELQNLVSTRTNKSTTSVRSLVSDSIPTHSHTPQKLCTTPSTDYTNHSVDITTNPRSTNISKTLSGFYSRNPRPPA